MTEPASLLPMARYMQSQEGGKGREEGEREGVSVEGGREGGSVLGKGECVGEGGRELRREEGREGGTVLGKGEWELREEGREGRSVLEEGEREGRSVAEQPVYYS